MGVFVAERLSHWFEETVVASDAPGVFEGHPFRFVPDVFAGAGTLGGLHGALAGSGRDWTFIAACDMPFIAEPLVRLLWSLREGWDAVVPRHDGRFQVTCGLYSRACLEPAARLLEAGRKQAIGLFDEIRLRTVEEDLWRPVDAEGTSFLNLNTPEEFRRAGGEA
jgi:molybdopterin-guanine dinucleotide biosynthesis protein A